jgi:RTX calcium-binding nonapeptide repeat (4 copies)
MRFPRSIAAFLLAGGLMWPAGSHPAVQAGSACTLTGTPDDDQIVGTPGSDVICGLGGDDQLAGLGGDDVLDGGPGIDILDGGAGTDLLLGGSGEDELLGGDDGDYLNGGPEGALLDGGPGADACLQGTASSCFLPSIGDPGDAKGRLDVRKVRSHAGESPPRWKVITFGSWTIKGIWDDGYFLVSVDTQGDAGPDYHVLGYSNGKSMVGGLYREKDGGAEVRIGGAAVSKAGKRGVVIKLPLSKLDRTRPYFRWSVTTLFTGKHCGTVCFDRVPGQVALPQAVLAEV